jgi:hypothetical protein
MRKCCCLSNLGRPDAVGTRPRLLHHNRHPQTAQQKVFSTVELLDHILLHCTFKTAFSLGAPPALLLRRWRDTGMTLYRLQLGVDFATKKAKLASVLRLLCSLRIRCDDSLRRCRLDFQYLVCVAYGLCEHEISQRTRALVQYVLRDGVWRVILSHISISSGRGGLIYAN